MQGEGEVMRKAALLGLIVVALGAVFFSSASADTVRLGSLVITIDGGITPKALPKKDAAPITLDLSGTLKSSDGSHPVALRELDLEFDKNGHLNTKGLATCTPAKLQSTLTAQAKQACGDALVGQGK